jgi:hypothetical protein
LKPANSGPALQTPGVVTKISNGKRAESVTYHFPNQVTKTKNFEDFFMDEDFRGTLAGTIITSTAIGIVLGEVQRIAALNVRNNALLLALVGGPGMHV